MDTANHIGKTAASHRAGIALGSNLNDPPARLDEARRRLAQVPGVTITAVSSYYATAPVGVTDQPWFVNAAVLVQTTLAPAELLTALLGIEAAMGRVRQERWGPRVIDLDLLWYNAVILETEFLRLPHPEMHRRGFVLAPVVEIAPLDVHPRLGRTMGELWAELPPADRDAIQIQRNNTCTGCSSGS